MDKTAKSEASFSRRVLVFNCLILLLVTRNCWVDEKWPFRPWQQEVVGVLELGSNPINREYWDAFGKLEIVAADGTRYAAVDNRLERYVDRSGKSLLRENRGYSPQIGKRHRVVGVVRDIDSYRRVLERQGRLQWLRYPSSADALLEIVSLEVID